MWSKSKQKGVAIWRRERGSERWQALGVGPQRKVRKDDTIAEKGGRRSLSEYAKVSRPHKLRVR